MLRNEAATAEHTLALSLLIEILGVWLCVMVGSLLHRLHWTRYLPESGATVLLGLVIGALVGATASDELASQVGFEADFFKFVLLPIIVFEGGYALRKRYFFRQIVAILLFAVAGTLISTLVVGGTVYAAAEAGLSINMPWPEAFAFASLISATDPVATLAVFGALQVDETLNALVAGESIFNDAVSIVLFQLFTRFVGVGAEEPTSEAAVRGIGSFFAIMIGSAALGVATGIASTWMFRLVHLGWNPVAEVLEWIRPHCYNRNSLPRVPEHVRIELPAPSPAAPATPVAGSAESADTNAQLHVLNLLRAEFLQAVMRMNNTGGAPASPAPPPPPPPPPPAAVARSLNASGAGLPALLSTPPRAAPAAPAAPANADAAHGLTICAPVDWALCPHTPQHPIFAAADWTSTPESTTPGPSGPSTPGQASVVVGSPMTLTPAQAAAEHARSEKESSAFIQTISLVLFCYGSFILAEVVGMSGIVTVLFAGVHSNHYTRVIMTPTAARFSTGLFRTLASLADTAVFFTIGLDVAAEARGTTLLYDARFIALTLLACLVGRALNVFPLSACLNCRRRHPIPPRYQMQMWAAGLRGAIAYASALSLTSTNEEINAHVKGCTAAVVIITVFAMGCTAESLLVYLKIPYGPEARVTKPENRRKNRGRLHLALVRVDAKTRAWISGPTAPRIE